MKSLKEFSVTEFESGLTPVKLLPLQVIQAALGMGTLLFSAILFIVGIGNTPPAPENTDFQVMQILSILHGVLAGTIATTSGWIYQMQFSSRRLELAASRPAAMPGGKTSDDAVDQALGLIRTAWIIRLAMLEGAAMFGLTVCLLGVMNGTMAHAPEYALNAMTPLLFLFMIAATFPTHDRVVQIFRERIASS